MKNIKGKWVMFWITAIVTVLAAINGATGLQMLPMIAFLALAYLNMIQKKELSIAIVVLACLMALLNFFLLDLPSWADVILWMAIAIVWM